MAASQPPLASASRWTTAADRVAVVVNGNAKQVTDELVESLDQIVQSGDLFVSRSLEEGREIARTIVERGYPTVLTGGGDGTFVQMVSWVVHSAEAAGKPLPRFGLLKLGTGNALAWVLGAQNERGRGVVADLARLRHEGGSRQLRLLEVEDMLTPFAGLGADAIALADYRAMRDTLYKVPLAKYVATGPVVYSASLLTKTVPHHLIKPVIHVRIVNEGSPAIRIGQDGRPVGAPIEPGDVIYAGPARLLAFSTIPYWGLGARIFPYADERDDRFNLRVVNFGSVAAVVHLRQIWQGTYRSDRLHDFLADKVTIHCKEPTPLQIGGDVVGIRQTVRAELSSRPIRVVDYYSPPPV
ncbi:MAG TPA: diacylglycerol kinase family protein [Polyangiales bacterium]|nr:diacylglycerol kinase family protein [Polyangiales bacterium]